MGRDEEAASETEDATAAPVRRAWWRSGVAYWLASVAVLVGISTWLYGTHVVDGSWILHEPDFDWAQEVWFLGWPAYAITHGHNPFYSSWINYPRGMNLMENTSMPLLGIVFAPVTWLAGPVVTYSVVLRTGLVASACSAQWVGRRLGLSKVASFLAGLCYACSTIELVEGNGHAFLIFVPLPPLIAYATYRAATGAWRPWRAGLTAGLLLGAQALISLEIALMTAMCCVLGLAVAALACPRSVSWRRSAGVAASGGWALLFAGAVLVVPMLTYFGPGHFWGPAHADLSLYRANAVSIVVPTSQTWLAPFGRLPSSLAYRRENGAYLGVLAVACLLAVAVRGWRRPLVRVGSLTVVVLVVLSFGVRLDVSGTSTGLPMPWAVLGRLPFLDSLLPVRLFIPIGLLAGLLLAWGLDRAVAWSRDGAHRALRLGAVTVLAAAVVASLAPAQPYPGSPTGTPTWLDSAEAQRLVPPGTVALFYPYPSLAWNSPMLYQAVDGYRYRLIGGQGIVTTRLPNRHAIGPLPPFDLPTVFLRASTGERSTPRADTLFALPPLPALDAATVAQFRQFASVNHVGAIVVTHATTSGATLAARYLTAAFGPPVVAADGTVLVWPGSSLRSG